MMTIPSGLEQVPCCVLYDVLKHLSPEEQFSLEAVCRKWQVVVQALWTQAEEVTMRTQELANRQLYFAGKNMRQLTAYQMLFEQHIDNTTSSDDEKNNELLYARFRNLEQIAFYGCYFDCNGSEADLPADLHITQALLSKTDLKAISIVNCNLLSTITAATGPQYCPPRKEVFRLPSKSVLQILANQRSLQFLELDLITTPTDSAALVHELSSVFDRFAHSLKGLVVYSCGLEVADLVKCIRKLKHLSELSIHFSGVEPQMPHFLHILTHRLPRLEYLCISGGDLTPEDINSTIHLPKLKQLVVLLNKTPLIGYLDKYYSQWRARKQPVTCFDVYTDERIDVRLSQELETMAIRVHRFHSNRLWLFDDQKLSDCLELDHIVQLERHWCFKAATRGWKYSVAKKPIDNGLRKKSDTYYDGEITEVNDNC